MTDLRRTGAAWELTVRDSASGEARPVRARFVFVGAGGGTLPLLRASGLPVASPPSPSPGNGSCAKIRPSSRDTSRKFTARLRPTLVRSAARTSMCVISTENACSSSAPSRRGRRSFSIARATLTDLPASLRPDNLATLLRTGAQSRVLVRFLVEQATQRMESRLRALRDFYPEACAADWRLVDAGIRVQALKKAEAGRLSFGTEVVTAPDGSLAALLGASPGASVSANIALEVIRTCFPERLRTADAVAAMKAIIPAFDIDPGQSPAAAHERRAAEADERLGLRCK